MNQPVQNPNDFKVVVFNNATEFDFTPEMGCMYDSRPIFGISGNSIAPGESMTLPYHVGHRLAENLAKYVLNQGSSKNPKLDAQGQPMVAAIWDTERLERLKNTYLKELYSQERPIAQSETDRLMAEVEKLRNFVTEKMGESQSGQLPSTTGYQDKAQVIAELEKRGITHDKRKSKADLEKLLA